jgi:Putative zincin peptidase
VQELRPWIGKAPITVPPAIEGYYLERGEQLDIMRASLLGILLVPLWLVLFGLLVQLLGDQPLASGTISIIHVIVAISFAFLLIIVHELLHGVAVLLTGNLPSFGVGPGFAYTTCHSPLTRNAYILVVVLPLLVINLGAVIAGSLLPAATGWVLFLSIINTMGAGGDVWMLIRLRNIPKSALIVDMASGFAVYMPGQATTASPIEP